MRMSAQEERSVLEEMDRQQDMNGQEGMKK